MPNARPEARAHAVALRGEGKSYREIRDLLGVSMASLSLWLRDVPLTPDQRGRLLRLQAEGVGAAAATKRARRVAKTARIHADAVSEIGDLSRRELFLLGVAAYWCEGAKAKPWTPSQQVSLINSDAGVIRLFLAWLRLVGVEPDDLVFRISVHESAELDAATRYWSDVVGVDPAQFRKPTLKRHNPKTVRRNTEAQYVGCLIVHVRRSTELNRRIAGWWHGITEAIDGGRRAVGIISEPSGMV